MQALTYDVRRERDREKKEFMRGGAAALIQARFCLSLVPQINYDRAHSGHSINCRHSYGGTKKFE